jgi:hypothetical protein
VQSEQNQGNRQKVAGYPVVRLALPACRSSHLCGDPRRCRRENQLVGLPTVARVCRTAVTLAERWIGVSTLSVIRRWAIRPRDLLEPLAILATNSASGFFRAGHADAIGQGRTRDRREAWSASRDRTGRRGVSTIEDDRIGTPGGGRSSADVGRWNGQCGGEKLIGRHAKRS